MHHHVYLQVHLNCNLNFAVILTSNVGVPSDESSRPPSTALTCSYFSAPSSATLRSTSSAPYSAISGPPLNEPFGKICRLTIASTSATTGAIQVQPQLYP